MPNASFTIRTYGEVNEQPPYKADVNGNLPSVSATYPSTQCNPANFAETAPLNVWSINPGVKMAGGVFCYGVIEVPATGLTQLYSKKYVVQETVAQVASLRNT